MSKVSASEDFPTSDTLGTQIREWVNNQIREDLPPSSTVVLPHAVNITLSIEGSRGESVTFIDLRCFNQAICNGRGDIGIPGTGLTREVHSIVFAPHPPHEGAFLVHVEIVTFGHFSLDIPLGSHSGTVHFHNPIASGVLGVELIF